ncbi:MAG: hypothetical protein WD181_03385 [Solirubrobacterales bacterium]
MPGKRKTTPEQLAEAAKPMTRLEERREELRARFTEMQWDLGGAAYEMAARDYFRLDVLAGMAARLQTVDAELAEIERMSRLEKAGAEGSCAGCGSLHARGAIYCWRCGRNLFEAPARPALVAPQEPSPLKVETLVPVEPVLVQSAPVEAAPVRSLSVEADTPAEPETPAPQRPFTRPWSGASSPGQTTASESVTVPPFTGATEIPTFERPVRSEERSEADDGGV